MAGALEGIGLYTYEVLSRLVMRRPEDEFIFCFDRPFSEQFVFASNVTPVTVSPPARHALLFWWWYHKALPSVFKHHDADLLFSPDAFLPLSKEVTKTLITVHDLAYLHYPDQVSRSNLWYYKTFMPKYLSRADRIIAVSDATKADIASHFPAINHKVKTIYNGTRSVFSPLNETDQDRVRLQFSDGKPYFISVGALHPRKNIARLIKAFSNFKSSTTSDTKLLIIGRDAWKTREIKAAQNASPVATDIVFLNYVEDVVLAKLMASSRALIYISLFEGFGLPIVEAMQSGIPVITSNRSSMKEIGGDAVKLVNPENISSISDAIRAMDQDDALASSLVVKGFDRAGNFDWDRSAASHSSIIDELL